MKALDAIKARAEAATPGPWEEYDSNEGTEYGPMWCVANDEFHNPSPDEDAPWLAVELHTGIKADAEFIAHAREDVDRLVTAIEAVLAIGGGGMEIGCFRGGYEQALHHVRLTIERALEEGKQDG